MFINGQLGSGSRDPFQAVTLSCLDSETLTLGIWYRLNLPVCQASCPQRIPRTPASVLPESQPGPMTHATLSRLQKGLLSKATSLLQPYFMSMNF